MVGPVFLLLFTGFMTHLHLCGFIVCFHDVLVPIVCTVIHVLTGNFSWYVNHHGAIWHCWHCRATHSFERVERMIPQRSFNGFRQFFQQHFIILLFSVMAQDTVQTSNTRWAVYTALEEAGTQGRRSEPAQSYQRRIDYRKPALCSASRSAM